MKRNEDLFEKIIIKILAVYLMNVFIEQLI